MSDDDEMKPRRKPHVLVVEDETLVAMLLEDMLVDLDCVVVGPAARLSQAVDLAENEIVDLGLLDVNLSGQEVWPVAEALARRNIPFAFLTGYGRGGLQDPWRDRPTLQKPFLRADLEAMIEGALPPEPSPEP